MRLDITLFLKEEVDGKTMVMETHNGVSKTKAFEIINEKMKENADNIQTTHIILS